MTRPPKNTTNALAPAGQNLVRRKASTTLPAPVVLQGEVVEDGPIVKALKTKGIRTKDD